MQTKIAQQELETASKVERNDLFQKLVDYDPALAALLADRELGVTVPGKGGGGKDGNGRGEFLEGKYSPTFLRLEERFIAAELQIPINRARKFWR